MRTPVRSVLRPNVNLPNHAPGLRIGLLGGSFNPAHAAHRAASLLALKKIALDRVWWLVTPGNPLKDAKELAPLDDRLVAATAVADHPRIDVTGFEADIGLKYSHDTIACLLRECPGVRFVWIMGADNLKGFHRWKNWRGIFAMVPIAVVDRGGSGLTATAGAAAYHFARARIPETQARALPDCAPPAWVFLHGLKSDLSSTAIRAEKKRGL